MSFPSIILLIEINLFKYISADPGVGEVKVRIVGHPSGFWAVTAQTTETKTINEN